MKHFALITLILFTLVSCQTKQDKMQERITELEQTDTGVAHLPELADLYVDYLNLFDADSSTKAKYLVQSASYYVLFEKYENALNSLKDFDKLIGDSMFTLSKSASMRAYCHVQLGESVQAITAYERIAKMRMLEPADVIELTKLYLEAAKNSDDSDNRELSQLKAAKLLAQSGDIRLALTELTKFYNNYPESDKSPYAMMEAANILERQFMDIDSARSVLQALIERYPDDPFARDARIYLDKGLLGKSDMEQFEIIRKNQGA